MGLIDIMVRQSILENRVKDEKQDMHLYIFIIDKVHTVKKKRDRISNNMF